MLFTEDRIIAEIRRIGDAIARLLGVPGALEIVRDDLDAAHRSLFGLPRDLTARLDPRSLAATVRADHRAAAIELLETEATLLEAAGDAGAAAVRRAQAEAIQRASSRGS